MEENSKEVTAEELLKDGAESLGRQKELELLNDEKNKPTPADLAAIHFRRFLPMFHEGVNKLSQRELRRVLKALVMYPLEEISGQHMSKLERQVLALGEELNSSKMVMMMSINLDEQKNREENKPVANDNVVNDKTEE